jgi:NTP pyrophosphatase (non-canonical NTP hydrolase)
MNRPFLCRNGPVRITDMMMTTEQQARSLNELAFLCHEANKAWWIDLATLEPKNRNVGELLMLCVSELAEAMEGHRKSLPDDKLPHRSMMEVEIADCLIRLFDLCGGKGLDVGGAFIEKMAFNASRADHKIENRKAEGGKKY